jgi:hypothetical protein
MRRHLASFSAVLAAVTASLGLYAGSASAASTRAAGLSVASSAGLATTSTTPTTPKPKPTKTNPTPTTPTTPAVKGSARLYLFDAFYVDHKTLIVPNRRMHVSGVVRPYVPGQVVTVKAFLGHDLIKTEHLRVMPSSNRRFGRFVAVVQAPKPGILRITVSHQRTAQMKGFSVQRAVASLDPHASFGSTGAFVQLVQSKLLALHLYIPQSGVYDEKTGLAIDAYHRLMGQGTSQGLDGLIVSEMLDGRGAFKVRYPGDGKHVEGDLGNQLLAEINGSKVYAIYPISSGKPSTPTVLGRFRVYQRTPGYLPDGMYYSDFFFGGYAIHGFDPAPDFPASHGCMRLPITDAISVWNWLTIGVPVDVYA